MLGGCINEPIEAMLVNDGDGRSETGSRWTGLGRGRRGMCKRQGGLAVRGERKELAWEWGDAVSVRSIGNARPRFGGMYGCVVDRSEVGVRVTCAERGGLGCGGGGEGAGGRARTSAEGSVLIVWQACAGRIAATKPIQYLQRCACPGDAMTGGRRPTRWQQDEEEEGKGVQSGMGVRKGCGCAGPCGSLSSNARQLGSTWVRSRPRCCRPDG